MRAIVKKPAHFALRPGVLERVLRWMAIGYVVLLVAVPLAALIHVALSDGVRAAVAQLMNPVARASLWLTVWTGLFVGVVNAVLGTATAWVLARYHLPGRRVLSAVVDLPLAIPTLVAGVMIAILYGPTSRIGKPLHLAGIDIAFAKPGIVLALLFVTVPFVVRAVEPILHEIDPAEEEAAVTLGAGPYRTFRSVILPAILPSILSGSIRSVGRALGEFGAIIVVAGNIPFRTLTAPVFIFSEIESGSPAAAAAVSCALLAFALLLHGLARKLEQRTSHGHATQ